MVAITPDLIPELQDGSTPFVPREKKNKYNTLATVLPFSGNNIVVFLGILLFSVYGLLNLQMQQQHVLRALQGTNKWMNMGQ